MRRRLLWAVVGLVLAGGLGGIIVYVRRNVVPPDCGDARTLALVRQSLIGHFGLPPGTRVENVHTVAGGPLAFRFVCEGDLAGYDPLLLRPGAKPGFVRYTTQLAAGGSRQEVTVEILPLLMWEKVF